MGGGDVNKRALRIRDWVGMAAMVTLLPLAGLVAGLFLIEVVFQ